MKTKKYLIAALALLAPMLSHAQDKIYKRDGSVIDAKIKSVGIKSVTYSRFDNQTGPEYTVVKGDVEKIVYQNGTEDKFPGRRMPRPGDRSAGTGDAKASYGRNVVAIAPLQFSESGLGTAISYERILDKRGLLSFYLPAIVVFNVSNNNNNYTTVPFDMHKDMMFYAMPGIKIYPTGALGVVRYGVGPSLVVAAGEKTNVVYDYNGYPVNNTLSRFMFGMVLNNSLNMNPSPHIMMGFEFGLGFTYLHTVDGVSQNTKALVQGGFKVGYRF